MTKDNNNDKNKMTEEELEILADKIATKVITRLVDLNDISDYFRTSYTFKPFMEFYKPKKMTFGLRLDQYRTLFVFEVNREFYNKLDEENSYVQS